MDAATLVPRVLTTSYVLMVVALGLDAHIEDVRILLTRPSLFVRSLLSMDVIMPIVAVALAYTFALNPAVEIALVALALSPVHTILPRKQVQAGGRASYVHGLFFFAGLVAIVFIPVALEVVERVFNVPLHLAPAVVAKIVLTTVLGPLAIGAAIKALMPGVAAKIARPLGLLATVLLLPVVVLVLAKGWRDMVSLVGHGALVAFGVFVITGLVAGHLLGGPEPEDSAVLALATSTRHPGVAMTIAAANFPDQKLVLPAVLLFLIVSAILELPYIRWVKSKARREP